MRTYIISFYQEGVSEDELAAYLDTKSQFLNWLIPLPNTIFIVSKGDANSVARLIEKKFPDSLFLVAEYYPRNSNGLLSEDMWDFLNHPEAA